ncbi:MAG: phospholipid carrier-dependent glycosyltransferase [Betaproteobacteria bacterium HGW-Betaproteobacteria-11]|nr:MAG: phospholipid carrier-dependent glycosyltransferase [Betaproteobacteria bacterium HGW-Betaproteobacteria-11]
MTSTPLRRGPLLLALLTFAVLWFGALDHRRLINPDEGRYAEIPREMVVSGDWLTPRLNDLKYFEKPPLQYWATAAAYTLFGEHHWTARLWPALTGFFGVLFTGWATALLFTPAAGLFAAAVLASSLLWNLIGHTNTLDMGVSFFLAAAVHALCLAQRATATAQESRRWQDAAWVLLALAILSKGLIGLVLPAATVLAYALWQRDWGFILRIRPWRGCLILLLVSGPWLVAVSLANPEFAHFFFIHEHLERFLTKVHHRYEPPWFFLPILIVGMLPWLGSLWPGLLAGARQAGSGREFQPQRFLLAWAVVVFVFFSISDSKLPSYILPIFPALASLIALEMTTARTRLAWQMAPAILIGLAGLLLTPYVIHRAGGEISLDIYRAYQPWLYAAAGLLTAGGAAATWLAHRGRAAAATLVLAAAGFLGGQAVLLGHDSFGKANSAHDIVAAIRGQVPSGVPFYSVNTYDPSFQFYLRRTTTMVEYKNELSFGIAQEPEKFIPDLKTFAARWQADSVAWALTSPDTFAQLKREGLPMIEVARDPRRVVIRKPDAGATRP